jgi:hypothetical protein
MDLLKKEQIRPLFQMAIGIVAVFVALRRKPIPTAIRNPEPFPNQTFARTAFFVAGAAWILGGCWSLWLVRLGGLRGKEEHLWFVGLPG